MKKLLIAAAFVSAFTAMPTMAASYSQASLSNFQVSLVDLDLNDGITPFIHLRPFDRTIYGYAHDSANGSNYIGGAEKVNNVSSLSNTATLTTNTYSASIFGENFADRVMQTNSYSLGAKKDENNFGYDSGVTDNFRFTLSGNTQLQITAEAFNYIGLTGDKKSSEYAISTAYMYMSGFRFQDDDYVILDSDDYESKKDFEMSNSTLMTLILSNTSLNNVDGNVYSAISSSGSSNDVIKNISTVPMPAALPLMASALGIFGLARRRNKAKAA